MEPNLDEKFPPLDIICNHQGGLEYWCSECKPGPCVWCGKDVEEHGPPGESKRGRPIDRLCPDDCWGNTVSSQFYTPEPRRKSP